MFGRREGIDNDGILHYECSIEYLLHTINHFRKDIDLEKLRMNTLVYGIKSASFLATIDMLNPNVAEQKYKLIENIDVQAGEYIFGQVNELNNILENGEKK